MKAFKADDAGHVFSFDLSCILCGLFFQLLYV